jgi:uroporphyrin-3 C-methyltransferase
MTEEKQAGQPDLPEEPPVEPEAESGGTAPEAATRAPDPVRRVRVVAVLALLLALGAAAGVAYLWQLQQQLRVLQSEVALQQQRRNADLSDELSRVQAVLQRRADGLQQDLATLRQQYGDLSQMLQSVRGLAARDHRGWLLAEAEYLLRIANHRLQLQGDPKTAMAALEAADQRLRELADPALLPVRERIAAENAALKAMPRPDVEGMAARLASLADDVEKLPLAVEAVQRQGPVTDEKEEAVDSGAEPWQRALQTVWGDLRKLVTIRRTDRPVGALLAPEQQYFLYENLRLKLATARLALLEREAGAWRDALNVAGDWLRTYFDTTDSATRAALDTLSQLAAVDIDPPRPDISHSLRELRQVLERIAGDREQTGMDTGGRS